MSALLAGCGGPSGAGDATSSIEITPSAMVNRIAYITSDGAISTINPDGSEPRRLTGNEVRVVPTGLTMAQAGEPEVFYSWPNWSPDGRKLAASRVLVEGANAEVSLEVIDVATGVATRVYENEPNTIPVARGAPHYTYWSPNNRFLTFIASTQKELALFAAPVQRASYAVQIAAQAPIYFAWANEVSTVLIHQGADLLYLQENDLDAGTLNARSLGPAGMGFRAPALSPDGRTVYYVDSNDLGDALYAADIDSWRSGARRIMDLGSSSAYLLSPTGKQLAVVDTDRPAGGVYDRLVVVDTDGASGNQLVDEPLLAVFWSPDGQKLIYIVFDPDSRSFKWKLANRSGEPPVDLVEFLPSAEFLTMISFFDQYSLSNSIWSPDSSHIVFTGNVRRESSRQNGSAPDVPKVYVLEVTEGAAPREIASSRIAFWSWN